MTAQQLEGFSNVDLSAADMRSKYKALCSPSPRKRPLPGLVLLACFSAVVCQVKAVLYVAKGQLSSLPPVSTHTCIPAHQVCLWWTRLCVQGRQREMTLPWYLEVFFLSQCMYDNQPCSPLAHFRAASLGLWFRKIPSRYRWGQCFPGTWF